MVTKVLPCFFLFAAATARGGVVEVVPAAGLVYAPDPDISVAAATARGGVVEVVPAAGLVYAPDLDTTIVEASRSGDGIVYGVSEHGARDGVGYALQGIIRVPYAATSVLSSPTLAHGPTLFVAE